MFDPAVVAGMFRVVKHQVSIPEGQAVQLATANISRPIVYFSGPSSSPLWLYTPPFVVASVPDYIIAAGTTGRLTWEQDGPMGTLQWYGYFPTPVSSAVVTVIEWWFYPEGDVYG